MNRAIGLIVMLSLLSLTAIAAELSVQIGSGDYDGALDMADGVYPAYAAASYYPSYLRYGAFALEADLGLWYVDEKSKTNGPFTRYVPAMETFYYTARIPDQLGTHCGARLRVGDSYWGFGKGRRIQPSLGFGMIYQWAFPQEYGTPHLRYSYSIRVGYRTAEDRSVFLDFEAQQRIDEKDRYVGPGLKGILKLGYRFNAF